MKHKSVLLFSFLCLCCLFTGCAETASGPTAPAAAAENAVLDNFGDSDLSTAFAGVTGTWTAGNDSAAGGSSSISPLGASGAVLGVTATVQAAFFPSASLITLAGTTYYGFVTAELSLSSAVNLATNNNALSFDMYSTNASGIYYRVFLYSSNGDYCKTIYKSMPATMTNQQLIYASDFTVPSGAAYNLDSVLDSVNKIVIAVVYGGPLSTSKSIEAYVDNVSVNNVP